MENLLDDLNPSQQEAVKYIDGPSLVIAGAGSGKTRVLTYKIAYLLETVPGLNPWNILALTFTNKAANEMKERIGKLVGMKRAQYLRMGTFHSIFSRILRSEAAAIGYTSNFTIYDETDSRSLLKTIIKEKQLDEKVYKPAAVHARISMAKNHLVSPDMYVSDSKYMEVDKRSKMPALGQVFQEYAQRCRMANAMDFDDLLVLTFHLFKDHEDIRRKYAEGFQFVLVDEYQDTNYAQQCIVLQLTRDSQKVCVVGDDYQSIYGFRGANIDNILDFKKIYTNPKMFKLEQNYRSTQNIVDAANSLMKHNERQIPKDVFSRNDQGERIIYKATYSDKEEALVVCKEIQKIRRNEHCDYKDFAILYRTNSQSRCFEDEMIKQNIPYRIFGGLSFYQRKEIKDVIAYFRLIANPNDEEAFKRIINYPARGIGNTTLQKIAVCAGEHQKSYFEVARSPEHFGLPVNKGTQKKLDDFVGMIEDFRFRLNDPSLEEEEDAFTLGERIIKDSGIYADIYGSSNVEDKARQENIDELISSLQSFVEDKREQGDEHVKITDYLQEVSLQSDLDSDSDGNDDNKVTLMTIHSAKGLEYPSVFVVGLDENIFPSQMSMDSPRELEEERRLLYVAITRAEKHCYLTSAQNRYRYGKPEFFAPSRFLKDIDRRYMEEDSEMASSGRKEWGTRNYSTPWGDDDFRGNSYRSRHDEDYHYNKPYIGSSEYDRDQPRWKSSMQNSRPVASQFMADPKPKEPVMRHRNSVPSNFRRVATSAPVASSQSAGSSSDAGLRQGNVIEHQRFGIGTVVAVEGTGENAKATVEFRNTGKKQLLLKFAKFKVIE